MKYDEITKDGINKLMDIFYAKVRKDANLGPIFNGKIGEGEEEWKEHKAKIASFWAGMFLGEEGYRGAPLQAHLLLPKFPKEFFDIWLDLFKESCEGVFEENPANALHQRATDIASRFKSIMYNNFYTN